MVEKNMAKVKRPLPGFEHTLASHRLVDAPQLCVGIPCVPAMYLLAALVVYLALRYVS